MKAALCVKELSQRWMAVPDWKDQHILEAEGFEAKPSELTAVCRPLLGCQPSEAHASQALSSLGSGLVEAGRPVH